MHYFNLLSALMAALISIVRTRADLQMETLALRHQIGCFGSQTAARFEC
jgi:hypothetical protein